MQFSARFLCGYVLYSSFVVGVCVIVLIIEVDLVVSFLIVLSDILVIVFIFNIFCLFLETSFFMINWTVKIEHVLEFISATFFFLITFVSVFCWCLCSCVGYWTGFDCFFFFTLVLLDVLVMVFIFDIFLLLLGISFWRLWRKLNVSTGTSHPHFFSFGFP